MLWSGRYLILSLLITVSSSTEGKVLGLSQCVEILAGYSTELTEIAQGKANIDGRQWDKWVGITVSCSQDSDANAAEGWEATLPDFEYQFKASGRSVVTPANTPVCSSSPDVSVPFPSGADYPLLQAPKGPYLLPRSPIGQRPQSPYGQPPPSPLLVNISSPSSVASTSSDGGARIEGHIWVKAHRPESLLNHKSGNTDVPMFRGTVGMLHPVLGRQSSAVFCDGYRSNSSDELYSVCCEFDKAAEFPDLSFLLDIDSNKDDAMTRASSTVVEFLEHIEEESQYQGGLHKIGKPMNFTFDGVNVSARVIGAGTSTIVFQFDHISEGNNCPESVQEKADILKEVLPRMAFRRITFPDESSAVFFYYHQIAHAKYLSERKLKVLNAQFWRTKKNTVYIMQPMLEKEYLLETYFKDLLIGKKGNDKIKILGKEVRVKKFIDQVTSQILRDVKSLDASNKAYDEKSRMLNRKKMLTGYLDAKYPNYQVLYDDREAVYKVVYMDPFPIHLQFNRQPSRSNGHLQYEKFDRYFHLKGRRDALVDEGWVNRYIKKFNNYADPKKMLMKLGASVIDSLFESYEGGARVHRVKQILLTDKKGQRYDLFNMVMHSIADAAQQHTIAASITPEEAVNYWAKRVESNMLLRLALTFAKDVGLEKGGDIENCPLFLSQSPYEEELIEWARELYGSKISEVAYRHHPEISFITNDAFKSDPDQVISWLRGVVRKFLEKENYRTHAKEIFPIYEIKEKKTVASGVSDLSDETGISNSANRKYRSSSYNKSLTYAPQLIKQMPNPDLRSGCSSPVDLVAVKNSGSPKDVLQMKLSGTGGSRKRVRARSIDVTPEKLIPNNMHLEGVKTVDRNIVYWNRGWIVEDKCPDIKRTRDTGVGWLGLGKSYDDSDSSNRWYGLDTRIRRIQRESCQSVLKNQCGDFLPSGVVLTPGLWPLVMTEIETPDIHGNRLCDFTPFDSSGDVQFWGESQMMDFEASSDFMYCLKELLKKLASHSLLHWHCENTPLAVKKLYPIKKVTFESVTNGLEFHPEALSPVISSPTVMLFYLFDLSCKEGVNAFLSDQQVVLLMQMVSVICDVDFYIERESALDTIYRLRPYESSKGGVWAARYQEMSEADAEAERNETSRAWVSMKRSMFENKVEWNFLDDSFGVYKRAKDHLNQKNVNKHVTSELSKEVQDILGDGLPVEILKGVGYEGSISPSPPHSWPASVPVMPFREDPVHSERDTQSMPSSPSLYIGIPPKWHNKRR